MAMASTLQVHQWKVLCGIYQAQAVWIGGVLHTKTSSSQHMHSCCVLAAILPLCGCVAAGKSNCRRKAGHMLPPFLAA